MDEEISNVATRALSYLMLVFNPYELSIIISKTLNQMLDCKLVPVIHQRSI